MDNAVTLDGYKYYVEPQSGTRPQVFVTFLNVIDDHTGSVNGVLLRVDQEALGLLDDRERNYDRHDITERILEPVDGRVWLYVGSPEARRRYDEGVELGTAVVDRRYYCQVEQQFRRLGPTAHAEYLASTDQPQCPVRELQRIDL